MFSFCLVLFYLLCLGCHVLLKFVCLLTLFCHRLSELLLKIVYLFCHRLLSILCVALAKLQIIISRRELGLSQVSTSCSGASRCSSLGLAPSTTSLSPKECKDS